MTSATNQWPTNATCLAPEHLEPSQIAEEVYVRVCRTDFSQPGFCVVNLGRNLESTRFRQRMVELKCELAKIHERRFSQTLVFLSAARFDQQNSTKPHLDGGPDESLLMLGYEPSQIQAELDFADYTRCARDLGIGPKEFMEQHNPMFRAGFDRLRAYSYALQCFDPSVFQIVFVNNSSASVDGMSWLGVLHTATIINPDESKRRIINSTMIAPAPMGSSDAISTEDLKNFAQSSSVRRRGYDKTHIEDEI